MNKREQFINYVKYGGETICSPQIGAGAGFDTKFICKEWITETTLEDTIKTVESFDIVPLINMGCPFEECIKEICWETVKSNNNGNKKSFEQILKTPIGNLDRIIVEEKKSGCVQLKYPVTCEEDLIIVKYYIDAALNADYTNLTNTIREMVQKIDGRAALDIQWPVQPYELLTFPNTVDTMLLANDCPELFKSLMDKIIMLDKKLMKAVAKGGSDFIFLGAPGSEMLSPWYYEEFIVPYSKIVTSIAHDNGLLVYSHICSPIEPFLTMGYYNKMGMDLFETISPQPVGNIISFEDAFSKIDPQICTRGNIGLNVLLNENTEVVKEMAYKIMKAAKGRKHMVAASDYLFYNVPAENIHAMAEAVREQ